MWFKAVPSENDQHPSTFALLLSFSFSCPLALRICWLCHFERAHKRFFYFGHWQNGTKPDCCQTAYTGVDGLSLRVSAESCCSTCFPHTRLFLSVLHNVTEETTPRHIDCRYVSIDCLFVFNFACLSLSLACFFTCSDSTFFPYSFPLGTPTFAPRLAFCLCDLFVPCFLFLVLSLPHCLVWTTLCDFWLPVQVRLDYHLNAALIGQ